MELANAASEDPTAPGQLLNTRVLDDSMGQQGVRRAPALCDDESFAVTIKRASLWSPE